MGSDLLDNAQAFEALFEEFLPKARALIVDSARSEDFNAADAHDCLDEIDGFATTIRDLMMAAVHKRDERRPRNRPLEPGEHSLAPSINPEFWPAE